MDLGQRKSQIRINSKRNYKQENDESDYSPQIQKILSKRVKKTIKKLQTQKKQQFNFSTWTLQENILYKDFLKKNEHLFNLEREQRRSIKINVLVSKFVKTRTSDQCRSHHQKMLIYHKDIPTIVQHIQSLEEKKDEAKINQPMQSEELETMNTPSLEMKEIEDVKKMTPSLWDCIVDEVWYNI